MLHVHVDKHTCTCMIIKSAHVHVLTVLHLYTTYKSIEISWFHNISSQVRIYYRYTYMYTCIIQVHVHVYKQLHVHVHVYAILKVWVFSKIHIIHT